MVRVPTHVEARAPGPEVNVRSHGVDADRHPFRLSGGRACPAATCCAGPRILDDVLGPRRATSER
ncbi:MAG: hypothetical protein ACT4OI_04335, partial [Methanobacteriota archaeon]